MLERCNAEAMSSNPVKASNFLSALFILQLLKLLSRFSYDLEMKTRQQNRNNERTEIERYDWFIKRIQTCVAFGWLGERSGEKTSSLRTFYNQSILRFDVILQHDWPIEQCLLHIGVFYGGKTKRQCFDLFSHWLIKQMTNTYRNHFLRSYENRFITTVAIISYYFKFVFPRLTSSSLY